MFLKVALNSDIHDRILFPALKFGIINANSGLKCNIGTILGSLAILLETFNC